MSHGIIRRIDELGRIVIPKEIRRGMRINENDPMELHLRNGEIILRKYKRSFEECAEEWFRNHIKLMDRCEFIYHKDYTFCIVPAGLGYTQHSRGGYAKRNADDIVDNKVIARVAAYANAMDRDLNGMIGYED